jgi:REP element-mobilizing transposase RayT
VTWRLEDSLPPHRHFDARALASSESFQVLDRLLDETRTGARYLAIPDLADLVSKSIWHGATVMQHYELHAFVVMPNHVHLLMTPNRSLPKILNSLKSFTARRASAFLARSGNAFWMSESYDHMVRSCREFEAIQRYIEENPVRALLVKQAEDYLWSSANGR